MRFIFVLQAIYYLTTGLWPVIDMDTFEAVTGPKTDDWLVKMVGLLAATIGAALVVGCISTRLNRGTIALSVLSILSFAAIDLVYSLNGTISKIYLADAVIQGILLIGLCGGLIRRRRQPSAD